MKKLRFPKISMNAPVVLSFSAVCIAAYILSLLTGGRTNELLFSAYRSSFGNPMTYIRCILQVFGHANIEHLTGNLMLILLLGPALEEKHGKGKMICLILLTALISGLANIILFPHTAILGTSSVVFAMILLTSFTATHDGSVPVTFLIIAVLYIGRELFEGLFTADDVSQFAHIIGGAVGSLFGFVFKKKR